MILFCSVTACSCLCLIIRVHFIMLQVSSLYTCSLIPANIHLIPKKYIFIPSLQRHHSPPVFLPVLSLWYILWHHVVFPATYWAVSSMPTAQLAFADDSNVSFYWVSDPCIHLHMEHPSIHGASIYPQTFHMHLKLKVLQIQFGIYFLDEPKCNFFPGAVHLSEASTQLSKLWNLCIILETSLFPLSCSTNLQIWMMCLFFFNKLCLFPYILIATVLIQATIISL